MARAGFYVAIKTDENKYGFVVTHGTKAYCNRVARRLFNEVGELTSVTVYRNDYGACANRHNSVVLQLVKEG